MKILVLAPHPFYQDRGTPIDVDLLLRALSHRGEIVDVVTYHEGQDVDYPHVTLHRIRAPGWLKGIRPGFSLKKLFCDLLLLMTAWRLVRRANYEVIHAGEESVFFAMLFKFLYGIPYVYDMDSSIAQQMVEKMAFLRPLAGMFDFCEAAAIRRSVAVAPVCNALADLAHERGATEVITLHDISQLCAEDFATDGVLRKRLEIDGSLGIYVGNLETYQGVDLLLESLQRARGQGAHLDLVIAGGLPGDIAHYRRKAARLGVGLYAHFIGPWPTQRLGELLAQADFLVAPRIKGVNTPMKLFPYLHSGRPVLVTRLPTHTQLLDDSVALLADPQPEAFAEAMIRLADDEDLRRRLGNAGRQFVEDNHTTRQYRERVDRLYELVGAKCQPAGLQPAQPR